MEIQMVENIPQEQAAKIAKLNDAFRKDPTQGFIMLSQGMRANRLVDIDAIMEMFRSYNDFNENNDPYGEHDFGAFTFKGQKIFWKIDYFDKDLTGLSPDASNAKITTRVATIMYAEEY